MPTQKETSWSFSDAARWASCLLGTPAAFTSACAVVVLWAVLGPVFGFSDTWQLVINTGTTIVTFLMVFLVQSTQNRDARALHLKWTSYCAVAKLLATDLSAWRIALMRRSTRSSDSFRHYADAKGATSHKIIESRACSLSKSI